MEPEKTTRRHAPAKPKDEQPTLLTDEQPEPFVPEEAVPDDGHRAEDEGHPDAQEIEAEVVEETDEPASTDVAVRETSAELEHPTVSGMAWNADQVALVKKTVAKGSSDDELRLFMHVCSRTGLDPFAKQIYFIKRWDAETRSEVFQPQTAIDGLRLIAERTGEYEGRRGPWWCGEDGEWKEVWTSTELPVAAKVEIKRRGRDVVTAVALMREYVQRKRDGNPTRMWSSDRGMPVHMIGKVAESLGLRAAFPQELGDVYSFEEMGAPAGQGDRADEAAENGAGAAADVQEQVVEDPQASLAEIDDLRGRLKMLEGTPGWAENDVVMAAAKSFQRPIGKLTDLRSGEVEKIIGAMPS